jgi:hypothetical protein
MRVFLDMVRTRRPPLPYEEVMETVRVVDAIERSLAAGGPVAP